jgi:hypothetical protein
MDFQMSIQPFTNFAACNGGAFLGFPHWYDHLPSTTDARGMCTPQLTNIYYSWIVVANVIEMLLYVAGIAAVVIIVIGGIQYIVSQGEPDKTAKAQSTILNSLIGLVIAVMAATVINYVAGRFNG